ncbi:hypothetical protein [Lysinibacillus pakistanensis]|uniref:hypothetical protein n=1 Tax=Lysinibacillus pakistanensis TaxID=759811 RepID=UPI003D271E1A
MNNTIRPNKAELEFLQIAFNRFYNLYEEVIEESFWDNTPYYRFSKINNVFSVYAEILQYEPIKLVIKTIKRQRPPMEAEIASDLFKLIRNIMSHFPFFDSWEEVNVTQNLINWDKEGKSIDKFFTKYAGASEIKYRMWDAKNKKMTYLNIKFPNTYNQSSIIYLRDILSEKEGVLFSIALMKNVLDTKVSPL